MSKDVLADVPQQVRQALSEDVGSGDITAELLPEMTQAKACLIAREPAVMCGKAWVDEVFAQLDPRVVLDWQGEDGQTFAADSPWCYLEGPARSLVTGERVALNFLQSKIHMASVVSLSLKYAKTICLI